MLEKNGKSSGEILTNQLEYGKSAQKNETSPENEKIPPVAFFKLYKYSTWKDKLMILLGIAGAFITGLTAPANTFIFGTLVDSMVAQVNSTMMNDTENGNKIFMDAIQEFAIYNSILGVLMLVFSYFSVTLFNQAAMNQVYRIRGRFLRSALNQDISWYDFHQSGEFASRMNEDLSKLEDGLGEKVVMFIHFQVAFLGSMILAFIKGWELALVCLSSTPVTLISVGIVGILTSKLAKKEMEEYAKAGGVAEEVFSAIRTVICFNGQHKETARYKEKLQGARKVNIKKGFFSGFGFGLLWFFIYAAYALAFWYGVGLVVDQKNWSDEDRVYSPGVMITVFFSVMMGSMNLGMSSPYIEAFGIAKGAAAKVFEVIERRPTIDPLSDKGIRPETLSGNITFENVCFEYPTRPDVQVLRNLSFSVDKGKTVALVGSSGCGKSTCIQLLQRFYNIGDGQILLDNNNIVDINVNWLRARIGVVGQEPVLFETTISENISYGKDNATREEIEAAAKAANAHGFIRRLPNSYNTLVGERGAQLSGGQKQRIAIARALVRNPDILLLDEATSALDTASEVKVQHALEKASAGRTTIIIAHRLSTIRNADKIIVFDAGSVVETGSHNALMAKKGHYFKLVTTQIGDDISEFKQSPDKNYILSQSVDEFDDDEETDIPQNRLEELETDMPVEDLSLWKVIKLNSIEWPYILIGSITAAVTGFAMPLFAVLFGDVLGILSHPDPDHVRSETNIYSLYFVITGIVIGLATFLQIYTFGIAGEKLTERLRGLAFEAMIRQEVAWFDDKSNGTGTLCARLSGDAAAVQGATGQRIGTILQSMATLFLGIGLSMYYQWKLGLLALAFTPFILIATYLQRIVMGDENMGTSKAMETSTKLAIELLSNIRTVVSLGRENMFFNQYMLLLTPSVEKAKRGTHYRGFVYGLARSLMFFAYAACMFYGGYLVTEENLFYADVFKVAQALIMGTVSIGNALAFAPNFQKGLQAAGKIFALLHRKPRIIDPDTEIEFYTQGNIHFKDVEFSYPSRIDTKVLRGLCLDVLTGKTVALVGPSGCGKSTCIQLIERFYDVTNGQVIIDNQDVRSVKCQNLRNQLGIVFQEPSVFDRTIAENIAYGDNSRTVDQTEIIVAAKKANIHNFIISLPQGYETRLGEKGTQLSGGQKQRIAIARALIRNPQILLFDEATSALDSESEKAVQDAIDVVKEGKTCITIAHRLSTIVNSDIIFVISAGIIVESGTHKELLNKQGLYYNLYKLQN